MRSTRSRILLAMLVVVGAVVFATGGSATQRLADATFRVFPGPGRVTAGQLIAYRATFKTKSTSTLNKVKAWQTIPIANGVEATLDSTTCPTVPEIVPVADGPDAVVCDFGTVIPTAAELVLTNVWKVPPIEQQTVCTDCLRSDVKWTVKEGVNDTTDPNDAFAKATLLSTVLPEGEIPEAGKGETLLAGGYEKAAASCAGSSAGNLKTQGVLGAANAIITKVCLPDGVFPQTGQDRGYTTFITETADNPRHTDVCVAALGTDCGPGYVDENFFATFNKKVITVVILAFVPKKPEVTTVSHNGVPMDADTCKNAGDCVVSIDYDNPGKFYTIVVTSGTNGFYDW